MKIVIRKCFRIMIVSVLLLPSCKESLQSDSTMSFDVDGSGVNIMSSELFDTISYLPLETTKEGLLGIMQKMRFSNSRYYFLTGYSNEKIIAFDKKSGEHVLTIDRNGRGPGEYVRATEFFVEKDDSGIEIYSRSLKKIIRFNSQGDFINDKNIGLYISSFTKYKSNYFLALESPELRKLLVVMPIDQDNSTTLMELPLYPVGDMNNFSVVGDFVSFGCSYVNGVYHMNSDGCSVRYYYDFENHNAEGLFPEEGFKDFAKVKENAKQNSLAYTSFCFYESIEFIVASVRYAGKRHLAIYCKSTGHTKFINSFIDNSENITKTFKMKSSFLPLSLDGDILIFALEPTIIKEWVDENTENAFGSFWCKIKESDNPIIMRCKLKQF